MRIKGRQIHYAWFVMVGCCFIMFYGQGLAQNLFSIFMTPLAEQLALSQTQVSSIASIMSLAPIVSVMIANSLFNKGWIRSATYIFGLMMGAGYILMAEASSLYTCYAAALIIGFGVGGGIMIPISIIITRWFDEKRGLALGIVTASSGVANTLMAPVLNSSIILFGIKNAFYIQALLIVFMSTIAMLLVRGNPKEKGVTSYGKKAESSEIEESTEIKLHFKDFMKTAMYWKLVIVAIVSGGTLMTVINRLPSFLQSVGYSMEASATHFSLFGVAMIIGKILYGKIIDLFGVRVSTIYIFSIWSIGIIMAIFIGDSDLIGYIFVLLLGLGSPIGTMMMPILVSSFYSEETYGTVFSSITLIQYLGMSGCLLIIGIIFDATGTYKAGFLMFFILLIIAFLSLMPSSKNA